MTEEKIDNELTGLLAELNDRQQLFCEEFVKDLNATQSAIRAGYAEDSARETGCENLTKPHIKAYISYLKKERQEQAFIEIYDVILELKKIAFADPKRLFNDDGSIKDIRDLDEDITRAIASIEVGPLGTITKLRLVDKKGALELLGKHVQAFTEIHIHEHRIRYSEEIIEIKKLAKELSKIEVTPDGISERTENITG